MRNELKHIEEIENYLLDNLTEKDKLAFETKMKNDPTLQEDVSLQRKITERIALAAFITDVKSFNPDIPTTTSSISKGASWFLNSIIALTVTGIAASGIYYLTGPGDKKRSAEIENTTAPDEISTHTVEKNAVANHSQATNTALFTQNNNIVLPVTQQPHKKNNNSSTSVIDSDTSDASPFLNVIGTTENVLARLQVPFEEIKMDAGKEKIFFTKVSQSKIMFPGGILQYEDGTPVKGEVTIRYREFRNAADMAFSGIPMTFMENGEEVYLNSAGMIELHAVQNGQELKIGKEKYFTLDYNVTDALDDCFFWSLDDKTKNWTKIKTISYGMPDPEIASDIENKNEYGILLGKINDAYTGDTLYNFDIELIRVGNLNGGDHPVYANDSGYIIPDVFPGSYMATVKANGYHSMTIENIPVVKGQFVTLDIQLKPKKRYHHLIDDILIYAFKKNSYNKGLKNIRPGYSLSSHKEIPEKLKGEYAASATENLSDPSSGSGKSKNKLNSATYPKTSYSIYNSQNDRDKKQAFSKSVYGLQCAGFGVYNCDQIARMKNPVKVRPSFGTGSAIPDNDQNKQIVVIDKNINSVFNFNQTEFTCNKEGKNLLLVYYRGKIYFVNEEQFRSVRISSNGNYDFPYNDITDQLQSVNDLKDILGL